MLLRTFFVVVATAQSRIAVTGLAPSLSTSSTDCFFSSQSPSSTRSRSKGQSCFSLDKNCVRFNTLFVRTSYIGTSYLLASTVFLPLFASIADIYGRHFGLQLSLLFFLVGSAVSTGAVNMPMILAGRGIAGIGAAGLLTVRPPCRTVVVFLTHLRAQSLLVFLSSAVIDRSNGHV